MGVGAHGEAHAPLARPPCVSVLEVQPLPRAVDLDGLVVLERRREDLRGPLPGIRPLMTAAGGAIRLRRGSRARRCGRHLLRAAEARVHRWPPRGRASEHIIGEVHRRRRDVVIARRGCGSGALSSARMALTCWRSSSIEPAAATVTTGMVGDESTVARVSASALPRERYVRPSSRGCGVAMETSGGE
jgi:hypothetical protein